MGYKILITGNQGYVGSRLSVYLKKKDKNLEIYGSDIGYFKKYLIKRNTEKKNIFKQYNDDFSQLKKRDLLNIDCVIHLASISNDPIGNKFKKLTIQTNILKTKKFIKLCKKSKVKNFIFASSCSVYGNNKRICCENTKSNPLTIYAISKVLIENFLKKNSNKNFLATSLRFATASGTSPRIRNDIVVNNLVMSAIMNREILLNSDGGSLRPLIDIDDMCKTFLWFIKNRGKINNAYFCVNVGSKKNNFKIINLAKIISRILNNIKIKKNIKNIDKRSYKVSFKKLSKLRPKLLLNKSINKSIKEVYNDLKKIKKNKISSYIRLNQLEIYLKNAARDRRS